MVDSPYFQVGDWLLSPKRLDSTASSTCELSTFFKAWFLHPTAAASITATPDTSPWDSLPNAAFAAASAEILVVQEQQF
jgi:hypothetical protein